MGRTFENRKHAMAKRADRDAKAFTKAGRNIAMAVRAGGPEPEANPALRRAIQNARAVNMPKDKIQNAIDKAAGVGAEADFQEIIYEGYGPHGVAIIVVTATDNPTRTVANVRLAFRKGGGTLGNSGSVAFLFDQVGEIRLSPEGIERDELELELIDDGLEDLVDGTDDDGNPLLLARCAYEEFGNLMTAIEGKGLQVASSGLVWVPKTTTELDDDKVDEIVALVDRIESDDDVQEVFTNLE